MNLSFSPSSMLKLGNPGKPPEWPALGKAKGDSAKTGGAGTAGGGTFLWGV